MKLFIFAFSILISINAYAGNINKTKIQIEDALVKYSEKLPINDDYEIKERLKFPDFFGGDEWRDFDGSLPRYSMDITQDIRLKIDIDPETDKVYYIWLSYPKERELDYDVITMKKAMLFIASENSYNNKKTIKQYDKFMNTTADSKGKANYKIINNLQFINHSCSDKSYCLTIGDI